MKKMANISEKFKSEKGIAIVYVALLIVVFIGMAALAIDIGRLAVVRNQLQNAADTAALAGCNYLYNRENVVLYPPPEPLWVTASTEASNAVSLNTADNKTLPSSPTIVYGWWDITKPYQPDQWSSPPSSSSPPPSANYGPAIRVTIDKTAGQNNGPITNFFAQIFGINTSDSSATATAVAASPGTVRPNAVPPYAISKEAADQSTTYSDSDHLIAMGTPYQYPNSSAGQWTSFFLDTNNVTDVRGLMDNGNPTMLNTGDLIWIQPGVKDTLYDNSNQPSMENNFAGKDVVLPVIDAQISDTTHSEVKIAGFVGFHIVCAGKGCNGLTPYGEDEPVKNNSKIVMGYFITKPVYGGSGPVGPHYGPVDRCRLCR